jgi:hypothetical protein
VQYIYNNSNPSPPTAQTSNDSSQVLTTRRNFFSLFLVGVGLLYPVLSIFLLGWAPQLFGFPASVCNRHPQSTQECVERLTVRNSRRVRSYGACAAIALVYWGLTGMTIFLVLHVADSEAVRIYNSQDPWVAKFLILSQPQPTTGYLYTRDGGQLGFADYTWNAQTFGLEIQASDPLIKTQASLSNTSDPHTMNATCRSTGQVCLTADWPNDRTWKREIASTAELLSNYTLTVHLNNTTFTLDATTTSYQGIGMTLAPLGTWYYTANATPAVQVLWAISPNRACDGLKLNMNNGDEAWIIATWIWRWWYVWGTSTGNCHWVIGGP